MIYLDEAERDSLREKAGGDGRISEYVRELIGNDSGSANSGLSRGKAVHSVERGADKVERPDVFAEARKAGAVPRMGKACPKCGMMFCKHRIG